MNRLQPAVRRLTLMTRRAMRAIHRRLPDLYIYGGIGLVAFGLSQIPGWVGAVLAPAMVGLALIWIVREGAEPVRRG